VSEQLFKRLLNDIRVDLADEFDRNFERKAFFDQPWPANKFNTRRGSMMARTNNLRRSMLSTISGTNIVWSSSAIYAELHNHGGKLKVTTKMKRFFWAMYYQSTGAQTYKVATRKVANTSKNKRLSAEAEMWKAMALKQVGSIIKIPQRQFIGTHQRVHESIQRAGASFMKDLEIYVDSIIKKR
jgi:phage gpG-like protein